MACFPEKYQQKYQQKEKCLPLALARTRAWWLANPL